MSIDQLVAEALSLPVQERAFVAESLWQSVDDPFEASVQMDDATATALARRDDGQAAAMTIEYPPAIEGEARAQIFTTRPRTEIEKGA